MCTWCRGLAKKVPDLSPTWLLCFWRQAGSFALSTFEAGVGGLGLGFLPCLLLGLHFLSQLACLLCASWYAVCLPSFVTVGSCLALVSVAWSVGLRLGFYLVRLSFKLLPNISETSSAETLFDIHSVLGFCFLNSNLTDSKESKLTIMEDDVFAVSGSKDCLVQRTQSEDICPHPGVFYDDKLLPDPHLWTATWLECQQKCEVHTTCKFFSWKEELQGRFKDETI